MATKPNILLITSDQQHWATLGVNNPEIHTPNLDRFVARGTMFHRAYCPNPTCTPTRASIITGLNPSRHGAYSLGTKLPETVPTLGEHLRQAGYSAALIGKAHFQPLKSTLEYPSLESYPIMQDLEFWRGFHGPFYGFDHVELARNHGDEAHVGQHYAIWMEEKGFSNWRDCFKPPTGNNKSQEWRWEIPEEYHYNAWIAERTKAFLDEYVRNSQPFFLWSSFFDPHPPYLAPAPWDTMYNPDELTIPEGQPGEHELNPPHFRKTQEKDPDFSAWREEGGNAMHGFHSHLVDPARLARCVAVYYGMISLLDKYIGRILDHLEQSGLLDNTLVVFTTDHGHLYGHHGLTAKGAFHYEDMLRVPFIASLPGVIPERRESEALLSLTDLTPTFLEAAGLIVPEGLDGVSQWDVLRGAWDSVRESVLVENRHQPHTLHLLTRIDRRYKITVYKNRDYGELFDLHEDPGEFNNLWKNEGSRGIKKRLLEALPQDSLTNEAPPMPRIAGA